MNKSKVLSVLKNSKAIVRTVLSDGMYLGRKIEEEYTVLHETPAGWRQLEEGVEPNNKSVIILAEVEDQKTNTKRTIAVGEDFIQWPVKTNFVFRVEGGKTKLELNKLSDSQMKNMLKEEA
jgi:hypothetical protein